MTIRHIEEGSGISCVIIVNGEPAEFKLVVIESKRWTDGFDYRYMFVNEELKLAFRSTYSGGNTGFGHDTQSMTMMDSAWCNENKVFARTPFEISSIVEKEQARAATEAEERVAELKAKVAAINRLPSIVGSCVPQFNFWRTEAEYKSGYRHCIQGGNIQLINEITKRTVWLDDFMTKGGKLLAKKFEESSEWKGMKLRLPEGSKARDVLQNLVGQMIALKNAVRNA